MSQTLVFDIGRTNKKAILFDQGYDVIFEKSVQFEETRDEDGFPCDDLVAIQDWIQLVVRQTLENQDYNVQGLNFSAYGASLVHIDDAGNLVTPFYNYLKPIPDGVTQSFYKKFRGQFSIARETASPPLGMLNSGLQLYWLKYERPDLFKKIKWSIHFPQYLSYMYSGIPVADFTSIGCHTMLWDFSKSAYHNWVNEEGLNLLMPPIVSATTSSERVLFGKKLRIGAGIHDSSAALVPYIRTDENPFLLISTGTWSITFNPFNETLLTEEDLKNDCLNFLSYNGHPVRAARLFLGAEYVLQVQKLQVFFQKSKDAHKKVLFERDLFKNIQSIDKKYFSFVHLNTPWGQPAQRGWHVFKTFEKGYHQLIYELVLLQVDSLELTLGKEKIDKVHVVGGFANNDVFVQILTRVCPEFQVKTTHCEIGSALGAAMVLSNL